MEELKACLQQGAGMISVLSGFQNTGQKAVASQGNGRQEGPVYGLSRQLKEALASELQEYCGLLVLLASSSAQSGSGPALLKAMAQLQQQMLALAGARQQRDFFHRELACSLGRSRDEALPGLIPLVPPPFRPALSLLLRENQRLLQQVQQEMQENIQLVSRWMESVQSLRQTIEAWHNFPECKSV